MPTAFAVQIVSGTDIPASPPENVSPLDTNLCLSLISKDKILCNLRQKLSGVFLNFEQLP